MTMARSGSSDPVLGTLLPLTDATDPAKAGRKAAVLADLLTRGFRVPAGWVVPMELAARVAGGERVPELGEALAELPDVPLAVRSSGVAEDGDETSLAGQYESLLGVQDPEQIRDAIAQVWHSGQALRIRRASDALGEDDPLPTAILLQPMLTPDSAGVAFSANPVSGERDEVVIDAVAGLGDRLMAGAIDPESWVVRGERVAEPSEPRVLTVEQAWEIAALARSVEAAYGVPQDIEWVYEAGELHLLQARPITALPVEPQLPPPPPGVWMKETEHFSGISSVAFTSLFPPAMEAATRAIGEELGFLGDCDRLIDRAGELYYQSVPLDEQHGPPPPGWLLGLMVRVMPSLRARLKRTKAAIAQDLQGQWLRRWHGEWKAELRTWAEALKAVDLPGLDDAELAAHIRETRRFHDRGTLIHFYITIPVVTTAYDLVRLCRELFGWDDAESIMLIAASAAASSEPTRALADLVAAARARPGVVSLLADPDVTLTKLTRVEPEFGARVAEYLDRFGHRTLENDVDVPTLYERPELVLNLIREHLVAGDPSTLAAVQAQQRQRDHAAELLASRPAADRARFERTLERAEDAYASREDNIVYTLFYALALPRYALLEAGRRFSERRLLNRVDDIFFFSIDEVVDVLRSGETSELKSVARRRRAERAWTAAHPGPAFIGGTVADLDVDISWLPEPARTFTESFLWFMGRKQPSVEGPDGRRIVGTAVSPGRHQGPVRIIRSQSDFHRLKPGDVLVCPSTTSAWGVLFGTAGALVTDHGGVLSHPSIAAREHGIPAVVGVGDATTRLRDGQQVIVDGSTGVIDVLGE
jgi:rifampicin phosphotransferase